LQGRYLHMKSHGIAIAAMLLMAAMLLALASAADQTPAPAKDVYGHDLPSGAVARLGNLSWRHPMRINFLAFLPDGKSLLSADLDSFHVTEFPSGKVLRRFGPGPRPYKRAQDSRPFALSPDTKTVAAWLSLEDKTIQLWDVATGRELASLPSPDSAHDILALAFSPDGKQLASLDAGAIQVWDLQTGMKNKTLAQDRINPEGSFRSGPCFLAYSAGGASLIAVGLNNAQNVRHILCWDPATGKDKYALSIEEKRTGIAKKMMPTAVSPDGRRLAYEIGGLITLIETTTGKELRKVQLDSKGTLVYNMLAFSPDSKNLFARSIVSQDIVEWPFETANAPRVVYKPWTGSGGGQGVVVAFGIPLAISPNGKTLASGNVQAIEFVDLTSGTELFESPGMFVKGFSSVAFTPDGKHVIAQEPFGDKLEWEVASGKSLIMEPKAKGAAKKQLQKAETAWTSPDGVYRVVVHRGKPGSLQLVETASGKVLSKAAVDATMGVSLEFSISPGRKILAFVEGLQNSARIVLYDLPKLKPRSTIVYNYPEGTGKAAPSLPAIFFSADGSTMAGNWQYGSFTCWDTATGRKCGEVVPGARVFHRSGALSPDGRNLALIQNPDAVTLWELASAQISRVFSTKGDLAAAFNGSPPPKILGGGDSVMTMFSPDGKLLIFGRADGVVQVWDAASGKTVRELKGHFGNVECLDISPDGKTLISGSTDTTALLWDLLPLVNQTALAVHELTPAELETRWKDLEESNAVKAYDAILALKAARDQAVTLLQSKLKPAAAVDAVAAQMLIAKLDDAKFEVRQKATAELFRMGRQLVPLLEKALDANLALESRRRLEDLRDRLTPTILSGEELQVYRGIEVLERIGTPEAQQLLRALAGGPSGALATQTAKTALNRLKR
jgi:WD40 repeat protein